MKQDETNVPEQIWLIRRIQDGKLPVTWYREPPTGREFARLNFPEPGERRAEA